MPERKAPSPSGPPPPATPFPQRQPTPMPYLDRQDNAPPEPGPYGLPSFPQDRLPAGGALAPAGTLPPGPPQPVATGTPDPLPTLRHLGGSYRCPRPECEAEVAYTDAQGQVWYRLYERHILRPHPVAIPDDLPFPCSCPVCKQRAVMVADAPVTEEAPA